VLLYMNYRKNKYLGSSKASIPAFAVLLAVSITCIGLVHWKVDVLEKGKKHNLFTICWSPSQTISNLSPIGYHIYDIYSYLNESDQMVLKPEEKEEIGKWFEEKKESIADNSYKAMFKGKNLIILQVESLENFVIGKKVDGQEITPNLNAMLRNSLYFTEFHEQVYNGTSSDGDLMANASVYPVRRGSTFFRFPHNSYNSLPMLMEQMGYYTSAIHPDKGSYWNWMEALKSMGFNKCMDVSSFVYDEAIGLGLSDGSFLRQVVPVLKKQKSPFYTFMVTLTSHGPFDIPQKYRKLNLDEKLDKSKLGGYFQSINYTDRQIGEFVANLKINNLLDNTVIVIYGDHEGVHKFYKDDILEIKPSEDWWMDNGKRVPFIIFQNKISEQKISTIGGQIDILPTVSYLMGVNESSYADTAMGRNLLKTNKNFVVLADRKYIGSGGTEEQERNAVKGIDIADKIISGNYFKK
jgi:lipoteichoic acid synthase